MILFPNAKINIGLHVGAKRPDGYHDLETLFYPVHGLHDELEVTVSGEGLAVSGIDFRQEGLVVDGPVEKNLVVRCYHQMAAHFPQIGPVSVLLKKHIPFGAGLGGGSSDAAHTAIALNELFHLGLSQQQLAREVLPLGADCPFFIYNTPCTATGIGEILTPTDFSLKGKYIVMIKPEVGISTGAAYTAIDVRRNDVRCTKDVRRTNDFEAYAFEQHPILKTIKQALYDAGAYYALMSGSGSTMFGLFETDSEGRPLADLGSLERQFASMVFFHDTLR